MNDGKILTVTDAAIEIVLTYNAMIRKAESIEKIIEIQTSVVQNTEILLKKSNYNRKKLQLEIVLIFLFFLSNSILMGYTMFTAYYGLSIIHFCLTTYLMIVCHNSKMILNDMNISNGILTTFFNIIKEKSEDLKIRRNNSILKEMEENNNVCKI